MAAVSPNGPTIATSPEGPTATVVSKGSMTDASPEGPTTAVSPEGPKPPALPEVSTYNPEGSMPCLEDFTPPTLPKGSLSPMLSESYIPCPGSMPHPGSPLHPDPTPYPDSTPRPEDSNIATAFLVPTSSLVLMTVAVSRMSVLQNFNYGLGGHSHSGCPSPLSAHRTCSRVFDSLPATSWTCSSVNDGRVLDGLLAGRPELSPPKDGLLTS